MSESLSRYLKKRDFKITPEPRGRVAARRADASFVVQKHAARRLHYDFRLEIDGTLKSWAVPKGPSLDPADKRMAVHVEDHPLEYGGFEGVIPEKQYGAGNVIVWDRGTFTPLGDAAEGYRSGKLKFELHGEKLRGSWNLVKMRGRGRGDDDAWLLIKERDEHARSAADNDVLVERPDSVLSGRTVDEVAEGARTRGRSAAGRKPAVGTKSAAGSSSAPASKPAAARKAAPKSGAASDTPRGAVAAELPPTLAPQLATLVDAPPADTGDWTWEIKFDGYRLLARIEGREIRLFTRNGNDWTSRLEHLARELRKLPLKSGWIDGEIVVLREDGVPDFQALQNAFETRHAERIRYYVFDLPYADGLDLRRTPLRERRRLLRERLSAVGSEHLLYSDDFAAAPDSLLRSACEMRMEGLIGKRTDSAYASGRRSPSWIKLKCTHRQEFVIGGYTEPQGSRSGLGALALGLHDADGALRFAGSVGTGFDNRTLLSLRRRLDTLVTRDSPFVDPPRSLRATWVEPRLLAEVSFTEWTKDGRVRHPVFHGLREDKPARAIGRERAAPNPARAAGKPTVAGIEISNPERVVDVVSRTTKLELAQYYDRAARFILPHLVDRPVAMKRAPRGIDGTMFFQKHANTLKIPKIRVLDRAIDPAHPPLLVIDSLEALVGAVQMGAIEFHTWNATTRAIEQPDRMTFDLDPGEGVDWDAIVEAALLTRTMLEELGLTSFVKTSGGKGLHVVVPLAPRHDWDTVKSFSQAIVQHLATEIPARFVAKSGPTNRKGRIFVDYLRNGRGATTVAAYVVRARPGMGVSIPIGWDELESLDSGAHWTIRSALERLSALDADPWQDYRRKRQSLQRAMKALGFAPEAGGARRR